MAVIYVKEQGAMIQKSGERIIISKGASTLLEAPLIQLENLALIGNVQITTQALHMLMEQGVDVAIFPVQGNILDIRQRKLRKIFFSDFNSMNFT